MERAIARTSDIKHCNNCEQEVYTCDKCTSYFIDDEDIYCNWEELHTDIRHLCLSCGRLK
jgi:hypothetical protein